MVLEVKTVTPHTLIPPSLSSGNLHIVRKRRVEILPQNSNVTFSPDTNDRIIFNISSANEFLSGGDSFIRTEFRAYGDALSTIRDRLLALSTGGIHSCIQRMILRLQNGTEISRIDDYAKWYAANSYGTHSRDHVEYAEQMSGDSVSEKLMLEPTRMSVARTADFTLDTPAGAEIVTMGTADYADVLTAENRGLIPLFPEGASLVTNTVSPAIVADIIDVSGLKRPQRQAVCLNESAQTSALGTTGVELTFRVPMTLLQQASFFPVCYVQGGLQLEIQLTDATYALMNSKEYLYDANGTSFYSWVNPRFVATMCQPSEDIHEKYHSLYKQDKLYYPYQYIRHFLTTVAGSTTGQNSYQYHPNVRSLRSIIVGVQNENHNTIVRGTAGNDNSGVSDCAGTFTDSGIDDYQFKVGSDLYPDVKIDTTDVACCDLLTEMMKTFGQHSSVLFTPRFAPWELRKENKADGAGAGTNESKRFLMTYNFARDDSVFSGVDCSLQPLSVDLNFGSADPNTTRYIHTWVSSDSVLVLGSSGVVRVA